MASGWFLITVILITIQSRPGISYEEQRFAVEPNDQTAIVGSRVMLPCRVINKSGVVQWTKDDLELGPHRNLPGYDRYRMIGSDEEGDYSLEMNPVLLEDDAKYQCQVGFGPQGQPGIRSRFATVTVLVPPEPPKIIQGESLVTIEYREIELECISVGGRPAAKIMWIDDHGNVLIENVDYTVQPHSDGLRFTAKSILKLVPRNHHHNTSFTCRAQNAADKTYRSAKLKLQVKYAPKVNVKIASGIGPSGRIPEGTDVTLVCQVDCNPPVMTYKWCVNNEIVTRNPTSELIIRNLTRKLHDAVVKCKVRNSMGESEAFETLKVSYGPRFRSKPKTIQTDLGSTVTLTCDVDGNPPPDIVWIHKNTEKVVGTSANLTLTIDNHSGGTYSCKASVTGFPEIEAEGAIYVNSRPTIISHRTQFGVVGDNVRLECVVFSIPRPSNIFWSFEGMKIDSSSQGYSILENQLPHGMKSTLLIHESESRHFGVYNCSVTNSYGMDSAEIVLKAPENFLLLIIVLGGILLGMIKVAVVLVILLCHRTTKKPPVPVDCNEDDKTRKEPEGSSSITDLKMEIKAELRDSSVQCELDGDGPDSETASVATLIGEPLADPAPLETLNSLPPNSTLQHTEVLPRVNGGNQLYRYSVAYVDPVFSPEDGYVPFVDYSRDYNPPPPPPSLEDTREVVTDGQHNLRLSTVPAGVDPVRLGNPYLPPQVTTGPNNLVPPSYSATRQNEAVPPQIPSLPSSPTYIQSAYIEGKITVKDVTLATHV